jgi:hypothetical protein
VEPIQPGNVRKTAVPVGATVGEGASDDAAADVDSDESPHADRSPARPPPRTGMAARTAPLFKMSRREYVFLVQSDDSDL